MKCCILSLFLFCSMLLIGNSADSLYKGVRSAKTDTGWIDAMNRLGSHCLERGLFDSALVCFDQALIKARHIGDSARSTSILGNIGHAHIYTGDFEKALKLMNYSLQHTAASNKMQLMNTWQNLGVVYENLGQYSDALEAYLNALHISEEIGHTRGIGLGHMNVGLIYESLNNNQEALNHSRKALSIFLQHKMQNGLNYIYVNMGNQFKKLGEYDSAMMYLKMGLEGAVLLGDVSVEGNAHNSLGEVYKYTGKFPEAIYEYTSSLRLFEKFNNGIGVAVALHNIGETHMMMKDYIQGEKYLLRSLENSQQLQFRDLEQETYKVLAGLYASKKDFVRAYEYQVKHTSLSDSLVNDANARKITEMQTRYETVKKDKEISEQHSLLEKKDLENQRRTLERNGFIAGFGLVIALAFFIYRGYRQKQKANAEITLQKKIIEEKQKDILDSIHYARRIQQALLPKERYIQKVMSGRG